MTYTIIERHPAAKTEVELGARSYPVPSVVEDQDGFRLLLTPQLFINVDVWLWAAEQGASAIISTDRMLCALDTVFADERTESKASRNYVLAEEFWRPYEPGMGYLQMAGAAPTVSLCPSSTSFTASRPEGFVHLHTHGEHSALDGLSKMDEIMKAILADGQRAVAITDHGVCSAHPVLQLAADKYGVKPIFGMEAYFDDSDAAHAEPGGYQHLVLWAMDNEGLKNLWALSTASFTEKYFYGKPRVNFELLRQYSAGVMASTACLRGPLAHPFLLGDEERALHNLAQLQGIFGDRLYVELHVNQLPEQLRVNAWLVPLAARHNLPLVAVVDSHYADCSDKYTHRVWLSMQTNKDVGDDTSLFGGDQDYHLMTEAEVRSALSYLDSDVVDEAIANTVRVADRCTARMEFGSHNPVFSKVTDEWPDPVEHDVDRLLQRCLARWKERTAGKSYSKKVYMARFEREFDLLERKGFCGYFLMVAEIVTWSKANGILVGPGRGSGGGSLVAYLIGITEIDPVENELLFERFMTEGRVALPDFDLDFPSSKKDALFAMVQERWGEDYVAIVGTHMRVQAKSTIKKAASAVASTLPEGHYPDIVAVCKIIDEAEAGTAGLGMAWEDLWLQFAEQLDPFRKKYPDLFELCDKLYGRLNTYGKHPAGVIISTDTPITGALPLRKGADGAPMVAQFDMEALEALGFVKFDLLNLRTLDTLQGTVDMIKEQTGRWVDLYSFRHDVEWADPMIYEELSQGWTLGVFQIETTSGTKMAKRFQPQTVAELADVITLVRPGPVRSGLTETYFRRRTGEEEVTYADPRLEAVLGKTYGCMVYQEDIMQVTMVLAGYDSNEADAVRKILGKKQIEKVLAEGQKFVARAVANGTDQKVAERLWEQMAEFAKYSFNRAHAFAYAILGVWTAWFKIHYPSRYLCATLSTVDKDRIPEFVEEARRMEFNVLPPDINLSGKGFSSDSIGVRYGLDSIKGVGEAAVDAVVAGQPYASFEDFLERKTSKCNMGQVKILATVGAFDSLVPNRRGLEKVIELDEQFAKGSDTCVWKGAEKRIVWFPTIMTGEQRSALASLESVDHEAFRARMDDLTETTEHRLPCDYPWHSEPDVLGRSGKPMKRKPPAKKCARSCRQFAQPEKPTIETFEPYTDEDIRDIEMSLLGVFLSSTPFDRIPEEDKKNLVTGVDLQGAPSGKYLVAAYITGVRQQPDRRGRQMAFLKCSTERGPIDVTVFGDAFDEYGPLLTPGRLTFMQVRKNNMGQSLDVLMDLDG